MSKLWKTGKKNREKNPPGGAGRVEEEIVEAFTVGNDYLLDQEILPYDLKASGVHAKSLRDAGILSTEEYESLLAGLDEIHTLWKSGEFPILREHEDGHTAIELWLTEKLGDLGKKIHTGRSRNDQVLTAMRLYEDDKLNQVLSRLSSCADTLLSLGEAHADVPMPGFTHTRRAMLSSVGQWAGGYAELLILQLEAVSGIRMMIRKSPLGTAAGFGTSLELDRDQSAEDLGLDGPLICATTAQLSRGWVELQLVQYLSGITLVLNRMAGDIVQFSSEAYRFFELGEVVCTGSSIMPQKKNPDVAELIRGKHALMDGYAATLSGIIRNLGAGYHRDLQLTKEPVIDALRLTRELLEASELLLHNLRFNREALESACSSELQAAEAANKLVSEEGWSFRDAYMHVKEGKAQPEAGNPVERLQEYTQLGSPGKPGLDRLRAWLERIS